MNVTVLMAIGIVALLGFEVAYFVLPERESSPARSVAETVEPQAKRTPSFGTEGERAESAPAGPATVKPADEARATGLPSEVPNGERARAPDLEHALGDARERLAEAERGRTEAADALRGERERESELAKEVADQRQALADKSEAVRRLEDQQAKAAETARDLQVERERADEAAARLAAANADATGRAHQSEELRQQLDGERARVAGLERDLAAAREREASRDRDAADQRERSRAAADSKAGLAEQPRRADAAAQSPGPNLAVPEQVGSGSGTQTRLASETDQPARPTPAVPEPPTSEHHGATLASTALPETAFVRVAVRYPSGDAAARAHAIALKPTLEAQGLDVNDPVATAARPTADTVLYFYVQDQTSADRVAGVLGKGAALKARASFGSQPPRPGTIEVSVAGSG